MIIVWGESETGKSSFAINLIKEKKNSLYILLDKDMATMNKLKENKVDFSIMNNCFLMDLKYRLLESGGLINNSLEYVVIDSINLIRDKKTYSEKIEYLDEMAEAFGVKIALVLNVLKDRDKIIKSMYSESHKFINVGIFTQQVPRLL
jgi:predicted metallo-beta-lactamase superfamily hydrolase